MRVFAVISFLCICVFTNAKVHVKIPTNILLILADDLGYGDTSVQPFVGTGISTPELENMAARGTVMSNFHTAAATCTPTRASILTGMYPWRVGLKAVYEYGEKGKSNRDDWLPQVPTAAVAFRDANYATGHSGKWHLGGMRNDDYDMRTIPPEDSPSRRCPHPGPNQQGFAEYVSVLDGPGAPRQNELQIYNTLYTQGCNHLIRNDKKIGREGSVSPNEHLSDCEARHAIRMMSAAVAANRSFYQHVWFHAPHGPWEMVPGFEQPQPPREELPACTNNRAASRWCLDRNRVIDNGVQQIDRYKSMVRSMDSSIGKLLNALKTLGIERNTLVVFLSDNGPEDNAGTTAGYRGNKRFIYEGGIRVPCIFQWIGTIPKGRVIDSFGVSTDLYPTFLHAAGIPQPKNAYLDGVSLLPYLIPSHHHHHQEETQSNDINNNNNGNDNNSNDNNGSDNNNHDTTRRILKSSHHAEVTKGLDSSSADVDNSNKSNKIDTSINRKNFLLREHLIDRITLWHNDFEGPRLSALWLYDFKVFLDQNEAPFELFDMRTDAQEKHNLLDPNKQTKTAYFAAYEDSLSAPELLMFAKNMSHLLKEDRGNPLLHRYIVAKTFQILRDYVNTGNEGHLLYLSENAGRTYASTPTSDQRYVRGNPFRYVSEAAGKEIHKKMMVDTCSTPCSCAVPYSADLSGLPFNNIKAMRSDLVPGNLPRASALLKPSKPIVATD